MSRRSSNHGHSSAVAVLITLIVLMIAASAFMVYQCIELVRQPVTANPDSTPTVTLPASRPQPETEQTEPPTEATTEPTEYHPQVVSTATIAAQGDLLMHIGVINSCKQSDGSYDFSSIFRYLGDYVGNYDYAAVNLETTLGGSDYPIQGNPDFNCPDSIVDAVKATGYDMLLTANNHCSDTHTDGILRTVEKIRDQGITALGTQLSDDDNFAVVDVNGIRIGMVCYTYATSVTSDGRPSLNFRESVKQVGVVNYFSENDLPSFYSELDGVLKNMEQLGAEASMVFIHWGVEYETTENATQRAIAQKLCDMGVDVIVGGHPHVVQPVDLLESTEDPAHKTVCIYSLGNAVSNQRIAEMRLKTGHTEDGALFSVTFEKYDDGSVYLAGADVLPTWVNMSSVNGQKEYNILPLDNSRREEWQSMFNLTDSLLANAESSYARTMALVENGLKECNDYLTQAKTQREALPPAA